MPSTPVQSLKMQCAGIASAQGLSFALRDFLDRFRESPSLELLSDSPESLEPTLQDGGLADAYIAGVAAYLAHENHWPAPSWAAGTSRALRTPYFAAKTPKMKALLLQESPLEFRLKHIFVSANALSRA